MKIAIFGASGRIGRVVVQQALDTGHEVVALVRTPSKLDITDPGLTVIEGDVMNATDVADAVAGVDAVISVLGPVRGGPDHFMDTAAQNIVAAMKQHGVRRVITLTGMGVRDPKDEPNAIHRFMGFLVSLTARKVLEQSRRSVETFTGSGLDWTVVRVPMLTDSPRTGSYRVGYVTRGTGTRLSRADAADFILAELTSSQWLHKMPALSG